MKGNRYKETVLKGQLECIYTVLSTYTRPDGELIALCDRTANNITPDGRIVPNYCHTTEIAASRLCEYEEL